MIMSDMERILGQQEQTNTFSFFKRIGAWFDNHEQVAQHQYEQKKNLTHLSSQVDGFLKEDMLEFVFELTSKGYKLNKNQESIFHQKMTDISFNAPNKFFDSLLKNGYTIEDQYLANSFFSYNGVYNWSYLYESEAKEDDNRSSIACLLNKLEEKIKEPEFARLVFDTWSKMIQNIAYNKISFTDNFDGSNYFSRYIHRPATSYINDNGNYMFSQCSLDEYLEALSLIQKIPTVQTEKERKEHFFAHRNTVQPLVSKLKEDMKINIQQQINDWKQKTTELFSNEVLIKNTIENTIQIAKHIDLKDIPEEAQSIIKSIKNISSSIEMDKLDRDQQSDIRKLSEKKIPEILQKYLSIHPDYRTTLKNTAGKNAQELMISSLKDIEEVMLSAITFQEENKLKDLSVQKRLTTEIKHRF